MLTVENGLSQNTVNHILQDSKGFLWFATNGGLNRYDGIYFETFVHYPGDTSSISNNIVNHLFEDQLGNIWISTQNGLNVYDQNNEIFLSYKNEFNDPYSISHDQVTCVTQDKAGIFWIGTYGGGLNRLDPKTQRFIAYRSNSQDPMSISSNFITCLEKDKYGMIWVGTADDGLNMLDPVHDKFLRYTNSPSRINSSISSNEINTIYEDHEGDLWIGTSSGIDLIKSNISERHHSNRDEVINLSTLLGAGQSAAENITSFYHEDQEGHGRLWFGSKDGGLGYYDKYLEVAGYYSVDPNSDYSLLSNYITSLLYDRSGILWIGTNSGISIRDDLSERFSWHKRIPGSSNSFSSDNIRSILTEADGTVWLGTMDHGLSRYDPLTDVYTTYSTNDFVVEGESIKERNQILRKYDKRKLLNTVLEPIYYLSHNRVNVIHKFSSNVFWIGTGGGGINVLNKNTNYIYQIVHNPNDERSISGDHITCIYTDSKNRRWIGTENSGLNLYDGKGFRRYQKDENDIFTLSSNHVQSITEDADGFIWIGTFGGGINKLDPQNDRFIRYFYKEDIKNGISSNNIYTLHRDETNKLWIGTTDGLNIFDLSNETFEHLTLADGLPSNSVYSILDGNNGNVWISTNKGISRINKEDLSIKNFSHRDGLQSTEFNPRSSYESSGQMMYFGGVKGYCSFNPENIEDNLSKPEVIFTGLKILNEKVSVNTPDSPLKKNISDTDTLELSYKDVSVSFEFVALNYTDANKNQYAYKMENFEKRWNYAGTRNFANYTNLQPGHYVFRVKASNSDGIWNEEGKSIYIIVAPPFWRTWWFYSLAVLFLIGIIILTIQLRTRSLHRSKNLLEEQVKRRTEQIKNQNKVLAGANKEILKQKTEIENQNKLLVLKNNEISKAKQKLDKINKKLVDINLNLEEKVEDRTSSLKQINEELINANGELDKFIYRASHDLKGPIARLLGISVLAKMDNKDETLKEYIELIEKGAVDINKVLNKLNNIHFINQEILQTDIIDFPKIIKDSRANLSSYIDPCDLKIELHSESKFHLRSDAKLMSIIMENLLENAVIFRKTKKTSINVILETDAKSIKISVQDDGLGIQKEQYDKVFEMFYRGSQKSKGNGLGLYLVKKAVQKLQGDVSVESEEGSYACFTISLPKIMVPKELKSLVS